MNITVIGTGFVGVVSSAVFASFGNSVLGLDIDAKRIQSLKNGKVPFYEPGLEDLIQKTQQDGNLRFTTEYGEAIPTADIIIIAVGTPSAPDGQADLTFVKKASESIAAHIKEGAVVAIKSTVPPGTGDMVRSLIRKHTDHTFYVTSLPEFLREGSAVADTLNPDRVIIGATEPEAIEKLKELHKPLNAPIIVMKPESAQMCKYAANAYLATRITFINQIANLCEVNGANILEVIEGIGYDKRIGSHYWYPGLSYGGSCFPKDVKELAAYARSVGQEDNLMITVDKLNSQRPAMLLEKFGKQIDGWEDKVVAVLGLSFKPNTDDMREAPSTKVIPWLLKQNARVRGFDPMASAMARRWFSDQGISESDHFHIVDTKEDALRGAQVILLLIEWPELTTMDMGTVRALAAHTAVFIDVRDQYKREDVEKTGMQYIGVGV